MKTMETQDGSKGFVAWLLPVAGLLVIVAFGFRTISNADFWTHLAVGRWIAGDGIPRVDVLSFTAAGQPWVNVSWLYDRILFALWNVGGARTVVLLHMLAGVSAFALLLPVRSKWADATSTALALILSAWILAPRFAVGPHLFGLLFTSAFILTLSRARAPAVAGIVLVVLQILWANMHASFILGPFLCAVFAVEAGVRGHSSDAGDTKSAPGLGALAGITVAVLLATLINPYHVRVYGSVLSVIGDVGEVGAKEWISPFSSQFGMSLTARHIVTLALIVGAGGLVAERRRLPVALTTLAMGAAFFVVLSLWYVDFFALLAFPFLALSLHAIGGVLAKAVRGLLNIEAPRLSIAAVVFVAALALFSLGAVSSNAYYAISGSASSFGVGVAGDLFPISASVAMEKQAFPERSFNLPTDGGFLLWRFPERQVFLDSRPGVYEPDIFDVAGRCLAGVDKAWEELNERWNPGAAIFNCAVPGASFSVRTLLGGRRWLMIYFDGTTAVLVKAVSEHDALAGDTALQEHGLALLERERVAYANRLGRCRRPANSPRLIGAANLYMALGRYAELQAVCSLLTRGSPEWVSAWQYLGLAEMQLGNLDAAERALREAARRMPKNIWPLLQLSRVYVRQGDKAGEQLMLERARKLNAQVTDAFVSQHDLGPAEHPQAEEE